MPKGLSAGIVVGIVAVAALLKADALLAVPGQVGPQPSRSPGTASTPTPTPAPAPAPSPPPPASGFVASVDTMKESKDAEARGLTPAQIAAHVNLAASLHPTHITVDTHYSYPAVMAQWVQAIRAAGKHVWFRPGGFGTPMSSPGWFLSNMSSFITANPGLFQSGDIFDGDPETENSAYWVATYGSNGIYTTAGAAAFNQFLVDLTSAANQAFQQIGVTGIITRVHSVAPGVAEHVLTATTVQALDQVVTIDAYPDANSTDPATAAAEWMEQLATLHQTWPRASILIGEMGYSNHIAVDDGLQRAVLKAELDAMWSVAYLIGINYWVGAGGAGYGGYTNVFTGSAGNWTPRPAADDLAAFYANELARRGKVPPGPSR